jgi:hypothetical protein
MARSKISTQRLSWWGGRGIVCIFPVGKGTKGGKMKGKVDILNEKTVCSTYFEILSHIEEIVINNHDNSC